MAAVALHIAVADRLAARRSRRRRSAATETPERARSLVKLSKSHRHVAGRSDRANSCGSAAQIEQVQGHGQREIAVGVETFDEAVALIGKVGADGELRLELRAGLRGLQGGRRRTAASSPRATGR